MSDELTFDVGPSPSSTPDAPTEAYRAEQLGLGYLKTVALLALVLLPWVAIAFVAHIASAGH
jgi:hypothetical protein